MKVNPNVKFIILLSIPLVVLFLMFKPFTDKLSTEGQNCYDYVCIKETIDMFESCIDLGYEDVGFMSSEHFYLCNGVKVTNTCLEHEYQPTNRSRITFGMRCDGKGGKK